MEITIIRPPAILSPSAFSSGGTLPPIGVVLLATYIRSLSHGVQVIDAHGENLEKFCRIEEFNMYVNGLEASEIVDRINPNAKLIGMSCMFSMEWFYCDYIIREIRKKFPKVKIVVGGEHVNADWKNVMRISQEVDYCIVGEGEESLRELIDALENNTNLHDVPGLVFKENAQVIKTLPRKRIKKLDDLPEPDWEMIPIQNYLNRAQSMTTLNRRSLPVLASRGCPFTCKFCTSPQMWGTELNLRSPDLVIAEIKKNYEKYKVEHFDFIDIVGVLNPKWTTELLTKLTELNLPITWLHGAGTRSEILSNDILDLFKSSKALRIFYAPESGSKTTLQKIRKRVNLDKMTAAMKYTKKLGISMRAPLIYGFPEQTVKEVFESIIFGLKLVWIGVDDIVVHPFSAYPGSEYFKELTESKKIDIEKLIAEDSYFAFLTSHVHTRVSSGISWSDHIPSWSIPILQTGSMALFYSFQFLIRPQNLIKSLWRVFFKRKPLTMFDHLLFNIFIQKKNKINYKTINSARFSERSTKTIVSLNEPLVLRTS